jgi:hypothetical protein
VEQILLGDDSRKQSKLMYKHFSYVGAFFAQPKKLMNKHLALALYIYVTKHQQQSGFILKVKNKLLGKTKDRHCLAGLV